MDAELKEYLDGMKAGLIERIDEVRSELIERIENTETRLLTEFWKWGHESESRMRRIESSDASIIDRMGNLSERVFALERKANGSKQGEDIRRLVRISSCCDL